jgi:hypothetical protein
MFNNKGGSNILKPASDGTPELDSSGNVIVSQRKDAKTMYISLDIGVFF